MYQYKYQYIWHKHSLWHLRRSPLKCYNTTLLLTTLRWAFKLPAAMEKLFWHCMCTLSYTKSLFYSRKCAYCNILQHVLTVAQNSCSSESTGELPQLNSLVKCSAMFATWLWLYLLYPRGDSICGTKQECFYVEIGNFQVQNYLLHQ